MYEIPTIPAWEPFTSKTALVLEYSDPAIKVFEDEDRLKISSNYQTGHNVCLYISLTELTQVYSIMPGKVRTTAIHVQDGSETRRKLLISFLAADERFGCCVTKIGGYSYLLKKEHSLYNKCEKYARKN
ncbi:MAG: hypothetical protein SCH70_11325 [Candidatus Methanoperedens sp.]|nr:hypothetical protein [Candidatus Methanoperedens sp.]